MKKLVRIYEVYETQLIIDADTDDQARNIAEVYLNRGFDYSGDTIPEGEFSFRLDKHEWKVEDHE